MKERPNIIPQTINYIEEHLQEDLNMDVLAKYTGYSKYHLNRVFRETVGCTIHRYIQRRRLTEAARQLVYSDTPIVEISFVAKYESQQAFTLAFRRLYAKTPQIYREEGIFKPKQVVFRHQPYITGMQGNAPFSNSVYRKPGRKNLDCDYVKLSSIIPYPARRQHSICRQMEYVTKTNGIKGGMAA